MWWIGLAKLRTQRKELSSALIILISILQSEGVIYKVQINLFFNAQMFSVTNIILIDEFLSE